MRFAVKAAIGIGLCSIALLANGQSPDPEIRIVAGDCSTAVQLVARNALLSDVLRRLAQSLDFQLQFEGNTDSVVNMNVAMPAAELVAKLSQVDSVIVTQARDPRCPAQNRIVKVWVLPKAKDNAGTGAATRPEVSQQQQQARSYEQMSRQRKEAYDAYVRTHGKPPPGEEEEVGKPR
jgi:hypothetical protein